MSIAWRRELPALLLIAIVAAWLLGRHIGSPSAEFDEQVYLASADLLTRGFELGRQVFTSQPPLFLTLMGEAHTAVGGDAALMRAMLVLLTIAGALGAWALVRTRSGAVPALGAAALVVLSPGVVEAAAVISADVPCVALGTLALLAASAARRRARWAFAAGLLLSCALLVKLLAAPFAVAIVVAAIVNRPPRTAILWFAGGILVAAAGVLLVYSDALRPLWHGAVTLHFEARGAKVDLPRPSILVAAILIVSAYVGLLAILAAGLLERSREQLIAWLREHSDLVALFVAGVALCAVQRPLLNHHLVVIAWPLALLAGSALPSRLPSRRTVLLLAAGFVLVVPWAIHGRDTVAVGEEHSLREAAAFVAQRTSPRATVVSDIPAVPVLALRAAAPSTVDPSYVRVQTGELSRRDILAAADSAGAVVVGRAFGSVPGLRAELDRRFGPSRPFGEIRVWSRSSPPGHQQIASASQK